MGGGFRVLHLVRPFLSFLPEVQSTDRKVPFREKEFMMPSGASYFVKKLNWSDKIFQLRSHEKFVKELQILGNLSNSNVMSPLAYFLTVDSAYLVYDLAPKGTLFNVLYSRSKAGKAWTLDWASRYSIAIGKSQGLAFLHGSLQNMPTQ